MTANHYIFVTTAIKNNFFKIVCDLYFSTTAVSHNAFLDHRNDVVTSDFYLPLNENKKLIMLDCRLIKGKGVDVFIKALALLDKSITASIQVVIFGDGEEAVSLKKLVTQLNLNSFVSLTGMIHIKHIQVLKSKVYFVVCPSLFIEALPLSALDAAALRVPIITSGSGGLKEVVIHGVNGLIYEPNDDPHALKNAMEHLLTNVELRDKLSQHQLFNDHLHPLSKTFDERIDELTELYCR